MVDWSQWEPGWAEAADLTEAAGLDRFQTLSMSLGVPIVDLDTDAQAEIVRFLAQSLRDGISVDSLERSIRPHFEDRQRSTAFANTMTAWAMSSATLQSYQDNGIDACGWFTEDDACPVCVANSQAKVSPGELFPSGHLTPPAHADCRCALIPSS
jgi:hypothetical protein